MIKKQETSKLKIENLKLKTEKWKMKTETKVDTNHPVYVIGCHWECMTPLNKTNTRWDSYKEFFLERHRNMAQCILLHFFIKYIYFECYIIRMLQSYSKQQQSKITDQIVYTIYYKDDILINSMYHHHQSNIQWQSVSEYI